VDGFHNDNNVIPLTNAGSIPNRLIQFPHGVGSFLDVHEGPHNISANKDTGLPIEAGNIF
jgi:Xaa-Pro aminopeptidase